MKFNLNEIFEIAVHIEQAGNKFYKKAAQKIPKHSDFFTFLANEEISHEYIFKKMESEFASKDYLETIWNPDNIISQYFDSLTSSAIFKSTSELDKLFDQDITIMDVIDWAIQREQETILFFTGLKEGFKSEDDRKKIDKIISEEINHVHKLMVKKSELI